MAEQRRLSLEHVLLFGILGASSGGGLTTKFSQDRVAEELKETREVIARMSVSLEETSKSLAVVVSKLHEHDRRLDSLETVFRRKTR